MIIIGLMSGTSIDAIDVACARFLMEGSTLVLERLGFAEMAWPAATRDRLLAALPPAPVTMGEVCALDVLAGEAFAEAAAMANERFCDGQAALVASHGQTLFHWIEDGQARGIGRVRNTDALRRLMNQSPHTGLRHGRKVSNRISLVNI